MTLESLSIPEYGYWCLVQVQDQEASSHSAGAVFDIDLSYRGEPAQHAALSHAALLLQHGIPLELGPVPDAPSTTSPRTVEALRQLLKPGTTLEAMVGSLVIVRTGLQMYMEWGNELG